MPDGTCLWFLFRFVSLSMFLSQVSSLTRVRAERRRRCGEVPVEPGTPTERPTTRDELWIPIVLLDVSKGLVPALVGTLDEAASLVRKA